MLISFLASWFYCLQIHDILLISFILTLIYIIIHHYFIGLRFWHIVNYIGLLAWVYIMYQITLFGRITLEVPQDPITIPFYSYYIVLTGGEHELLRSNFMNVVLFYPAGLLACELLPMIWNRAKRVILVALLFALVSAGIEICQYYFALGQAEIDDVIHNTLGALIGALVCTIDIKWKPRKTNT